MLRASAIASMYHMLLVGHRDHCKSTYRTWEITLTAASPFFACWPYPTSNRITTLGENRGILLLRINAAFPLPPHALYFLHKLWCHFLRMPCQNTRSSNRVQPSAYPCCAHSNCLTAAAQVSSPQALCWILSPTSKEALGTTHDHGNNMLWLFWQDHLLFLLCTCTCPEGRRAGRRSGPQLCFQNHISVQWGETVLPKEEERWHELSGDLQVGKGKGTLNAK